MSKQIEQALDTIKKALISDKDYEESWRGVFSASMMGHGIDRETANKVTESILDLLFGIRQQDRIVEAEHANDAEPNPVNESVIIRFQRDLARVINVHSIDSRCNVADFILANFAVDAILGFVKLHKAALVLRDKEPSIGLDIDLTKSD